MRTDIDVLFDQLRRGAETLPKDIARGPTRIPRFPLALLFEDDMRRRAHFLDSHHFGPPERWPYATPKHFVDELKDLARMLAEQSTLQRSAAHERVGRVCGYRSWEHVRAEEEEFEAQVGKPFHQGLVVAVTGLSNPVDGFTRDQRLIFPASRDLVHQYSAIDDEGGWYQLITPSTIGGGPLQFMACRQMFLQAVHASYWRKDNGVATFLRYDGEIPANFEAANDLIQGRLGGDAVRYIWLRGEMHVIAPLWD